MKRNKKFSKYPYHNRDERNRFIVQELGEYLGENILNIGGGGENHLKKYLPSARGYFEVDLAGSPDLRINLEKDLPLPFEDNKFDSVVCTDVLEHLDNLHEVFGELARVSKKYIIISLPNAVADVLSYFKKIKAKNVSDLDKRKQFGSRAKYYGLPFEKPLDRHKWFFSYTDVEEFLDYQAKKHNLNIVELFPIKREVSSLAAMLLTLGSFLGSETLRKNLNNKILWCVLEKKK
ncbi:MAG TPA: methyltransferase domain-containing protein [Candidatus Bipolaricaulota bacterium]|nr:methyltransferase domain-containing protein [Candidatus Bipolaricaulota bacterium]